MPYSSYSKLFWMPRVPLTVLSTSSNYQTTALISRDTPFASIEAEPETIESVKARLQGDIDLWKTLYETQRVRAKSAEQDVKNLKTELGNVGILLNQKDIELGKLKQENAALKAKTARLRSEGTKKEAIQAIKRKRNTTGGSQAHDMRQEYRELAPRIDERGGI
jgi:cell division protein FtsB